MPLDLSRFTGRHFAEVDRREREYERAQDQAEIDAVGRIFRCEKCHKLFHAVELIGSVCRKCFNEIHGEL